MKLVHYTRRARQQHNCCSCEQRIEKLTKYVRCVVFETLTDIWSCKFHIECWELEGNYITSKDRPNEKVAICQNQSKDYYTLDSTDFG